MANGIQILPTLDRFAGLRQGAQNFVGGLQQQALQRNQLSDQQAIMQFIQQRQQGIQPALPQFQTPQGAAAFNSFLGQQQENVALGPGQGLFNRATGQPVGQSQPAVTVPGKQTSSVIKDPDDPTKSIRVRNVFDDQGNLTNQVKIGEATLAESIGGVAAEGLSRGSKSKIETELVSLEETQKELATIDSQFNPDFFIKLNLKDPFGHSKTSAAMTAIGEKFGLTPEKARVKFLKDRTKFFADSKRVFLKFRKFITGVAGGLPEFREIAKASIDPENDSPTQFKAKMKSMNESAMRLSEIMRRVRSKGFSPSKGNISAEIKNAGGLDKIQIPGAAQPAVNQQPGSLSPTQQARMQELLRKQQAAPQGSVPFSPGLRLQ